MYVNYYKCYIVCVQYGRFTTFRLSREYLLTAFINRKLESRGRKQQLPRLRKKQLVENARQCNTVKKENKGSSHTVLAVTKQHLLVYSILMRIMASWVSTMPCNPTRPLPLTRLPELDWFPEVPPMLPDSLWALLPPALSPPVLSGLELGPQAMLSRCIGLCKPGEL